MISKEFVGDIDVVKMTPTGGKVTVAFGNIYTTDDQKLQAIAIQIIGSGGETVAEFALLPESFGVLLDAIKELYDVTI